MEFEIFETVYNRYKYHKCKKLVDQYELCFHQYGTSLKRITETGEPEYKKVNPKIKIDIELAKAGKYIAEELFEIQTDNLGKYGDEDIFVKNGKYGPYIQCGTKTVSIKSLGKPIQQVTLEDAIVLLDPSVSVNECGDGSAPRAPPAPKNPNIVRILNSDISIRKGKYGAYIYYMPADAKKPEFFQLGKMKTKYANMDVDELIKWIGETYNVCVSYRGSGGSRYAGRIVPPRSKRRWKHRTCRLQRP
jgi:topoisomerase IA-like protein